MGFDTNLPTPVFGVSTIPPVARPDGFCTEQVNWRNDPQDKLTVRPSTEVGLPPFQGWPMTGNSVVESEKTYVKNVDGKRLEVRVAGISFTDASGNHSLRICCVYRLTDMSSKESIAKSHFKLGKYRTTTTGIGDAVDICANVLDNKILVWNRKKRFQLVSQAASRWYKQYCVVNVLSALNYGETVSIIVKKNDVKLGTASWTVPGLTGTNTADADAKRATARVAEELTKSINSITATSTQLYAKSLGSSIAVYGHPYSPTAWKESDVLTLEATAGRGDSVIAVKNYVCSSIDGLPKYSFPNIVRKVQPDPTSDKGVYYLRSTSLTGTVSSTTMEEVVWVETCDPFQLTSFAEGSQFYCMDVDLGNGDGWSQTDWEASGDTAIEGTDVLYDFKLLERSVGDDETNPPRDFIGNYIEHIDLFQDRLLILSGNRVNLSKTKVWKQFWLNSATSLLVTDPTDVGTSGNNSTLKYAVFHNKDLLIFSSDKQFKLNGQEAITPQTAAMPITTASECNMEVAPVQLGSYTYYAVSHGDSGGIRRFEVQSDTNMDTSSPVTDHIVGYLPGRIVSLEDNANQTMLIVRASGTTPNEFFVFEEQNWGGNRIPSWCKWTLPEHMVIKHIDIVNEIVTITYNDNYYVHMHLKGGESWPLSDVRLDAMYETVVGVNGEIILPITHAGNTLNLCVIVGTKDGAARRDTLAMLDFTEGVSSDKISVGLEYVGCTVYVGYRFEALYEPTRPYERDGEGNARTTDRLRIAHYMLELSNTYNLKRRIISDHWDLAEEEFTSANAAEQEYIDEILPYTGQWKPGVDMNAADCRVQFVNDMPYCATIASISYRAQQYSTKRRR